MQEIIITVGKRTTFIYRVINKQTQAIAHLPTRELDRITQVITAIAAEVNNGNG